MMAAKKSNPVLQLIARMVDDQRLATLPDAELLSRFLEQQDQAAFHALVRRHGPMVLEVCRSVLHNTADIEDGYQATFMVLACKGKSVRKMASLASWLHGVAYRTACNARRRTATRQRCESQVARPEATPPDDLTWKEVQTIVHEEIGGLGVGYRDPLVLCYLEGKTHADAATQLGLPLGTLKGRLERGRALLRTRLVRRGLGPTAVLLAASWPLSTVSAKPGVVLMSAAVKAALLAASGRAEAVAALPQVAALAEGVLRSMLYYKLKFISVLLAALLTCTAAGTYLATSRGTDAPAVQDIAAQLKRQYDSLQSLHVKWRTTVDNPGQGVGFFATSLDEFAVSGKRQYRHWRAVESDQDFNQDLEKSLQVAYRDWRFLYDGQRFYGQGVHYAPPKKPVDTNAAVFFGENHRDFERNGRALYMECIGSPYYDGGHLGPWLGLASLGKIKGYVAQRHFSILTIFQGGDYRVREAKETVGGADCWVVEDAGQDKLWLDPARSYALVRREWNWGANRPLQFRYQNSDFKEVAAGLWLPLAAQCEAMYDPDKGPDFAGKVQLHYRITALWCQANNAPENLFQFQFTPGVLVIDGTRLGDGKQIDYVAGQTPEDNETALAQAIQMVKAKEQSGNQMVQEEERPSNRGWHIIWVSVVLGLVLVAYQLVKWWRGRPGPRDGPARPSPGTSG